MAIRRLPMGLLRWLAVLGRRPVRWLAVLGRRPVRWLTVAGLTILRLAIGILFL
jgi:hypothetical protein